MSQSKDITREDFVLPEHIHQDHVFHMSDIYAPGNRVKCKYYTCRKCNVTIQLTRNEYFIWDEREVGYTRVGKLDKPFFTHKDLMIKDIIT